MTNKYLLKYYIYNRTCSLPSDDCSKTRNGLQRERNLIIDVLKQNVADIVFFTRDNKQLVNMGIKKKQLMGRLVTTTRHKNTYT